MSAELHRGFLFPISYGGHEGSFQQGASDSEVTV